MRLAAVTVSALFTTIFLTPIEPRLRAAEPPDPAGLEFFEKKIRPALTEHCAACHSVAAEKNKKLKGGLFVDSRAGLLNGGDSGPAVVPGKPAESLLLKTMKYDGDVQMPPKGKLPVAVVKDFEKWIAMGAPAPRDNAPIGSKKQIGLSIEEGRKFWAYKLPVRPAVPKVRNPKLVIRNEIDAFVLAALDAKGLKPAPEADRAALARRLYYDLTGLPPAPEEVDAFANDKAADAYEKLVDKLLASPEFGVRWGRHWLDIARFAESVTLRGFVYPHAWRYRDYVIDSFNADVPFDQFIKEQLAGDLLPAATPDDRKRHLVATTFLQLGNTNLEEQDKKALRMDVVDEQLDVITKGFLAQTVTCARCHDHKFDPIPTKDYYALAGILRNVKAMEHANVSKWVEVPLPADPATESALKKHEAALASLQAKIAAAKKVAGATAPVGGTLAVKDVPGIVVDDTRAKKVGEWASSTFNKTFIGAGYIHDGDGGKGQKTLTFQPDAVPPGKFEVRLAYSPGTNRAAKVVVHVFSADGEAEVNVDMTKAPAIDGRFVSLGEYRFEKGGQAYVMISNEGTKGHVTADAVVFLSLDKKEQGDKPARAEPDTVKALEVELKKLQATGPKREMAMSVAEEKVIEDANVHVRGSVHNLGEVAPRGVLTVARYGPPLTIPNNQSGRAELAEWIASCDNPLTARVAANRVWYWLLGAGLVRTVDNFGTTGEAPSNPELLDHLASVFQAPADPATGGMGWSVKKLVRYIVLSRTYRQSVTGDVAAVTADPENQLFGRANRKRLEAEEIRDTVLAASGQLDLTRGGPTFPESLAADYGYKANSARRSVYLPQFRNALPEMLEVFDAADPSVTTGKRNSGTVAPQALFMMNHPFVLEHSKRAAARLLGEKHADDTARITRAYRLTLGREPTLGERAVAERFLKGKPDADGWTAVFHALFASAEFRYVN